MYRVDRNNFYKQEKNATIYTPEEVSNFLFKILNKNIKKKTFIFDPCVGEGSLLKPWSKAGFCVKGIDIKYQGFKETLIKNYLIMTKDEIGQPDLVIMNPPFNIDIKTKKIIKELYGGRPLLPEVWLRKTIDLFGKDVPIVMFTPYGFRLNQTKKSKRWQKFISKEYPNITSIVSLPKDIFENVLFHSEILIFNIDKLKSHYFLE